MQTHPLCMCTSPPAKAWFLKTPPPRQLQRNSPHYTPVSPAPLQNKAWIATELLKNSTCFNQIRCLGSHKSHLNTESFCVFRDVATFITELNLMQWMKKRKNELMNKLVPTILSWLTLFCTVIKLDFRICSAIPNWQKSDNSMAEMFYF